MLSIAVFANTPYAMPSAPSTNCAINPIPSSSTNSVLRNICLSLSISFCHALLSGIPLTPHAAVAASLLWRSLASYRAAYDRRVAAVRARAIAASVRAGIQNRGN